MLTMKILFTINSLLKKPFSSKHYLQFLSLKKKHLVLIRKKFISFKKIIIIVPLSLQNFAKAPFSISLGTYTRPKRN